MAATIAAAVTVGTLLEQAHPIGISRFGSSCSWAGLGCVRCLFRKLSVVGVGALVCRRHSKVRYNREEVNQARSASLRAMLNSIVGVVVDTGKFFGWWGGMSNDKMAAGRSARGV